MSSPYRTLVVADRRCPGKEQEDWANQFAMELLMPGFAVRRFWAKGATVGDMAKVFAVSREVMVLRLEMLQLIG